jgi:hypothetical protein
MKTITSRQMAGKIGESQAAGPASLAVREGKSLMAGEYVHMMNNIISWLAEIFSRPAINYLTPSDSANGAICLQYLFYT